MLLMYGCEQNNASMGLLQVSSWAVRTSWRGRGLFHFLDSDNKRDRRQFAARSAPKYATNRYTELTRMV